MMQRRKRFIKGLSLLVVLIICGLLINNWFFKLNTTARVKKAGSSVCCATI